jgi:hypothetical protein
MSPWSEITTWDSQPGGWLDQANHPADFHFFVFDTLTGSIDLVAGVWPGDARTRYMWIHRGFYDPFPTLAANYWDAIVGDHLVMHQAQFDAGYRGWYWRTDAGGLYAPYI